MCVNTENSERSETRFVGSRESNRCFGRLQHLLKGGSREMQRKGSSYTYSQHCTGKGHRGSGTEGRSQTRGGAKVAGLRRMRRNIESEELVAQWKGGEALSRGEGQHQCRRILGTSLHRALNMAEEEEQKRFGRRGRRPLPRIHWNSRTSGIVLLEKKKEKRGRRKETRGIDP